jgi:hypothetical protein
VDPIRRRAASALCIGLLVLAGLGGCASPQPGRVPDSLLSFERTFDMALGAMTDQRMTVSEQDRRNGRIVATSDGSTLVATVEPIRDGTVRVSFQAKGDSPADEALLTRVSSAYNARMANLSLLGGLKGSGGGSDSGPVPCSTGAALCP